MLIWVLMGGSDKLGAQTLPPHQALRILIVSDEVNPHGLNDNELTQPGDIRQALLDSTALNIDPSADGIVEIATNQIEMASSELNRPMNDPLFYDVLIYFAHRVPNNGNNDQNRQEAFVNAVTSYLENGGAVISFHHGIYRTSGKGEYAKPAWRRGNWRRSV